jgi:hypothetical protein
MSTIENLSTLKIHKLTKEQYEREKAAGRLDATAIYLTPNEEDSSGELPGYLKYGEKLAQFEEITIQGNTALETAGDYIKLYSGYISPTAIESINIYTNTTLDYAITPSEADISYGNGWSIGSLGFWAMSGGTHPFADITLPSAGLWVYSGGVSANTKIVITPKVATVTLAPEFLPSSIITDINSIKIVTNKFTVSGNNFRVKTKLLPYSNASTSAAGLMSAADKTKLDGISEGANKTTVDSSLSSTSINPVQNKVVNSALSGKQATLVSGNNIKTINGETLLGSGNIEIQASGGGITKSDLLDFVYPVGSIYMSVNNVSPQTFLGGTWVAWGAGRVPIAMGSNGETNYTTVEQTGGSENSVASHSHTQAGHSHTNKHYHRILSNTSYSGDMIGYGHNNISQGVGGIKTNVACAYYRKDRNGNQNSQGLELGKQIIEDTTITTDSVTPTINNSGTTGGNRMPFITCYMWKRTA